MFTEADHAKAVELYKRFGTAEWWPKGLMFDDYREAGISPSPYWSTFDLPESSDRALAAIAWAMVERLLRSHRCVLDSDPLTDEFGVIQQTRPANAEVIALQPTPFLALAVAIENTNKEA